MKAAIIGYGKMGREIERMLLARGHEVLLRIDIDNTEDLNAENLSKVDVAIEFTSPHTACANVSKCLDAGVPVVSGSTGWNADVERMACKAREKGGAFFYSSNYSIGMNVTFYLNRVLARIMNTLGEYDLSMDETHHIHKLDSPSGTAVKLAEDAIALLDRKSAWVNSRTEQADTVGIESFREGEVPGIHTVRYDSPSDTITLRHEAKSRRGLVLGAVMAAEFLQGRTGFFTMDDMLDFK